MASVAVLVEVAMASHADCCVCGGVSSVVGSNEEHQHCIITSICLPHNHTISIQQKTTRRKRM
eukprot:7258958-Ditylum_brightwellii.AAC.1